MAHRSRREVDDRRARKAGPAGGVPDATATDREDRICVACGRRMQWRAKWANNFSEVKYCSDACRKRGVNDVDRRLEASITLLLDQSATNGSICPSDAARAVGGEGWRELMEPARRAARRMVAAGEVQITQRGVVVDPSTARGPIRVRRAR
ncbi:MAG: DUF3253 domain-containing protein [Microbacteriaceae bacterium]